MIEPTEVIIRPVLAGRIVGVVMCVAFACFGLTLFIRVLFRQPAVAPIVFPFVAVPAFIGWTQFKQRVCATGSTLHVRNVFRDHAYDRASIKGFFRMDAMHRLNAAGPSLLGGNLVVALADGRTLTLYATRRGPFGRQALQRMQSDLERWLTHAQ